MASGENWKDCPVKAKLGWNCRDYYSSDDDGDGIEDRFDDDDDGDGIPDNEDEDHYEGAYDEECFKTDMEEMETIQTKFGSLVENCCDFDGYVDMGECKGTDKQVFYNLYTIDKFLNAHCRAESASFPFNYTRRGKAWTENVHLKNTLIKDVR